MFREMRRKDKQVTLEECKDILLKGEYGVLGTISSNGYPYCVPLNYVLLDNSIYFHCANEGHKLDNISYNNKVSFTVSVDVKIIPEDFSTNYRSVILFGKAQVISNREEKKQSLVAIIEKYSNNFLKEGMESIERGIDHTTIFKIDVDHITGKAQI